MVVQEFESVFPSPFSVMEVSRRHKIPHRRAYDFFNLLQSLGVCSPTERSRLQWIGLQQIPRALAEAYNKFEISSGDSPLRVIFAVGRSPTLGFLASRFLFLYLHLSVDILSIRDAIRVFRDGSADRKSLERRLYLVLSFLDRIGVVSHTDRTSEYRLMLDRADIMRQALARRMEQSQSTSDMWLEPLLNRPIRWKMEQIYRQREAEFFAAVHE
jgi:hypothetical protein